MNSTQSRPETPEGFTRVNVVFHGLWAFETTNAGPVIAYTPLLEGTEVYSHVFVAGSHKDHVNLLKGVRHYLAGIEERDPKDHDFSRQDNVVVDNKAFIAGTEFCSVELPAPVEIRSVRLADVTSYQPFVGADGKNLHPTRVAMVQVFIYYVNNPETVSLEPVNVKPTDKEDAWNLHIFAQPIGPVSEEHGKNAYKAMAEMFGLDIIPNEELFVLPSNPDIIGLELEDMMDLDDHLKVSGSNCDGLIIQNRTQDEYS